MVREAFRKRVGNYYLGRTLGEGTYAKVKYAEHAETREVFAIKVLDRAEVEKAGMMEQLKREITITKHLHHPSIVDLKEVMATRDKIYVVLELVPGGELFDKIIADGPLSEPEARKVFQQLLDGLDYCHRQGIYHRDLKPENVLLAADGTVKLSDFGLGALPDSARHGDGLLRTTCGTPNYVAPEVLRQKGYEGAAADVWSLGVLLYVITAGNLPFEEESLPKLFRRITKADFRIPPWFSDDLADLVRFILQPDPALRPSIPDIRRHPWVSQDYRAIQVAEPDPWSAAEDAAIFEENALTLRLSEGERLLASTKSPGKPRKMHMNAFQLINAAFDLSAIFDAERGDVVTRHTRFTCRSTSMKVLSEIEAATHRLGGKAERRDDNRTRLRLPGKKRDLVVGVEVFDLLRTTQMVEVTRFRGDTVEFYDFYANLFNEVQPALQLAKLLNRSQDLSSSVRRSSFDEAREKPPSRTASRSASVTAIPIGAPEPAIVPPSR